VIYGAPFHLTLKFAIPFIAVRIATVCAYLFVIAEKQLLMDEYYATPAPNSDSGLSKPLMLGVGVTVSVVLIALFAALVVYVIRHRRLQQRFTSFANSHYDSRRGTTTFGSNDLGQLPKVNLNLCSLYSIRYLLKII